MPTLRIFCAATVFLQSRTWSARNGVLQDHGVAPRGHGTTLSPAAPRLVDHYVRRAYGPWHTSTHGSLQKWPPGRRRGPPYPIICTCYSEANSENLNNI